jgi:two-component system response regulator YesN
LKNLPPKHGLKEWLEENRYTALTISLMHPSIPQFQYLLLFLPHDNRAQADHLTQEFENIILLWGEQQGASFYCGISGLHSNISDMHTAASESIQALNSRKILCNAPLCDYQAASADPVRMEWPLEEVFLFRMENGELNAVSELTGQLFDFYCSIPDCTLLDVKRHLEHMSSRCSILLNVYLHIQNQETRAPHNVQAIVNKLFSFDDLKQYYLQYFMNITRMVGSQSVYSTSDLVDRIQIYMQRNFQNNLTEDFLASLFYLNRSYLSQIFRKRTGMKFVDYLNQLRIERAKELLTSTDLKMYQIAKRVGYDNPKYFFRIFKKKTGLTPEQYRKPATT